MARPGEARSVSGPNYVAYNRVAPEFWSGRTGRKLREYGRDVQVVALYLITCPTASPLGVYYLPIPTLCHEINITSEGAMKALQCLSTEAFSYYDATSEEIYVVEMAKYQIAERITGKDKRQSWIIEEAKKLSKSSHFERWYARYKTPFNLPEIKPHTSPIQAPMMPTATTTATATTTRAGNKSQKKGLVRPSKRCPSDFELTDGRFAVGIMEDLDEVTTRRLFAEFKDHEYKSTRSDWDAAWRNWIRNHLKWNGNGNRNGLKLHHGGNQTASEVTMSTIAAFTKKREGLS